MLDKGISVGLLAYKEEKNLELLIPEIKERLDDIGLPYDIIVVDGPKSEDNSKILCDKYGVKYYNQDGSGFGDAFRSAIKYAYYEYFLVLDADFSHNPCYITEIYKKFITENYDVVIGSRYIEGGQTFDSKKSILMSKLLNTIYRVVLGLEPKDISTNYRIYKTEQIKKINLKCRNYDIQEEILLQLKKTFKGMRIGEIPICFVKRKYGESKRDLIPFIIGYVTTLVRLFRIRIMN